MSSSLRLKIVNLTRNPTIVPSHVQMHWDALGRIEIRSLSSVVYPEVFFILSIQRN